MAFKYRRWKSKMRSPFVPIIILNNVLSTSHRLCGAYQIISIQFGDSNPSWSPIMKACLQIFVSRNASGKEEHLPAEVPQVQMRGSMLRKERIPLRCKAKGSAFRLFKDSWWKSKMRIAILFTIIILNKCSKYKLTFVQGVSGFTEFGDWMIRTRDEAGDE